MSAVKQKCKIEFYFRRSMNINLSYTGTNRWKTAKELYASAILQYNEAEVSALWWPCILNRTSLMILCEFETKNVHLTLSFSETLLNNYSPLKKAIVQCYLILISRYSNVFRWICSNGTILLKTGIIPKENRMCNFFECFHLITLSISMSCQFWKIF